MNLDIIYAMDNVRGLREHVADESIDLTVTSPPYDNLRTYNGFSFNFESLAHELYRVTKPGGVVVWVVNDATVNGSETLTSFKQAIYFKEEAGFNVHDTMIYQKLNPVPLKSNRYQPCFEYMFILSKGKPRVFNPLKEPCKMAGQVVRSRTHRKQGKSLSVFDGSQTPVKEYKFRSNIWGYLVGRSMTTNDKLAFDHPAIFPEKLAEDHILSWSNPGEIVLDPFMGSGTTAKMAYLNNRHYIGFEISDEYVAIAEERLRQAKNQRGGGR